MDFLQHYKDLILNLFIIFLPLVFYKYTIKFKSNKWLYAFIMYILFVAPLIMTMTLPIETESTIYDLRGLPLIIGSLYGGVYTSILLFFSLVSFRLSLGGLNLLNYIVALMPTFIILCLIMKKYSSFNLRNKIITIIVIMFFLRSTVITIYFILGGRDISLNEVLNFSLPVIITQSLIAGFFAYLIEAIRRYKHLHDEIIETEKLRMVSAMAASVAHEIRNPLTAVRGFIQLLGVRDLPEEKRNFYSRICKEELDRAQKIISDYLSLAKPEHGKLDLIEIKDEFEYITNILGSYANYQNVQIINNVRESMEVFGDRSEFRQAVINLGKNAIEAMPNGGILEFRSQKINNMFELQIIDTGMGMSSEQVNRLGTPYYSTKEKGTGLGTMVSFNIIKKMSGKIKVISKLGKGTTYMVTIPLSNDEFV
jgi:two-component system sporulation sensor kinase B